MDADFKIITTLAPYLLIPAGVGVVLVLITLIVRAVYLRLKRKNHEQAKETLNG